MKYQNKQGLIQPVNFSVTSGECQNPSEDFAPDASRVSQEILVTPGDPASRFNAYANFLGWPRVLLGNNALGVSSRYIARVNPCPYDSFSSGFGATENFFLYCTTAMRSRPWGVEQAVPSSRATAAPMGKMILNFSSLPWSVKEDSEVTAPPAGRLGGLPDEGYQLETLGWSATRNVVKEINDIAGSFITLRTGTVGVEIGASPRTVAADYRVISQGTPVPSPTMSIRYTWSQVPVAGIPFSAIQNSLGLLNSGPADGFAGETLLFTGCRLRVYNSPFGLKIADVFYSFVYKSNADFSTGMPNGWNYLLDSNQAGTDWNYFRMTAVSKSGASAVSSGKSPLKTFSFQTLFRPDQPA